MAIKTRWVGLRSYAEEDSNIYFGRSEESEILYRQVLRQHISVIFGVSGIGKTSLINASLLPRLRNEGLLPIKFRFDFNKSEGHTKSVIQSFKNEVIAAGCELEECHLPVNNKNETLWEFFHRIEVWDKKNRLVTPVLILDQFEEVFTLGKDRKDIAGIIDDLADLIENKIPETLVSDLADKNESLKLPCERQDYKILISLREDFVPMLDRLKKKIPSLMINRFPLQHLNGNQAMEIILGPGSDIVEREVAEKIIRFAAASRNTEVDDLEHLEIEAALLSVVCSELDFGRRRKNAEKITQSQVEEQGSNILRSFYIRSFIGVSDEAKEFVEDKLLTRAGFRCAVPMEEAVDSGIQEQEIKDLIENRILRVEERLGIPNIELSHDLLCQVAKESREERVREKIIKEERRKFKKRAAVVLLITAMLVFIGNFSYKLWVGQNYERELAKLKKQGIPLTYEETFPDEKEILDINNAANDLKAISQLIDEISKESLDFDKITQLNYGKNIEGESKTFSLDKIDGFSDYGYRHLKVDDKEKAERIFEGPDVKRVVDLLLKSTLKNEFQSSVNKENLIATVLPHLSGVRKGIRLLTLKAVLEAGKGNKKEAADLLKASFKLCTFIFKDPLLVSHMVSVAGINISVEHFQVILQKNLLDSLSCDLLKTSLNNILSARKDSLRRVFLYEFAMSNQVYAKIISGETPVDELFQGDGAPSITVEDVKNEHLFFLKNKKIYNKMSEYSYAELQEEPTEKFIKNAPEDVIILRLMLPNVETACIKSYEAQVHVQQALTAIELKSWFAKNNSYPGKLSDLKIEKSLLIDPFTEKEFEYTATEKGFTLRSPGHEDKNNPDKVNEIVFSIEE